MGTSKALRVSRAQLVKDLVTETHSPAFNELLTTYSHTKAKLDELRIVMNNAVAAYRAGERRLAGLAAELADRYKAERGR